MLGKVRFRHDADGVRNAETREDRDLILPKPRQFKHSLSLKGHPDKHEQSRPQPRQFFSPFA